MQIVLDTNILVASLLKKGPTRAALFSKKFELFSPDNATAEILRNKEEFKRKSSTNERDFTDALELIFENISVVPIEEYAGFREKALSLCPEKHKDDWPFIALALKLGSPLWSNDSALKKQKEVAVYSTSELLEKLR